MGRLQVKSYNLAQNEDPLLFYTFTNKNMARDYKFLAIYKGYWTFIYRIKGKYYLENRQEVTRDEFIYIA